MYVRDKEKKDFNDPKLTDFWINDVVIDKFKVNNISNGANNNYKNYNKITKKSNSPKNNKFNKS